MTKDIFGYIPPRPTQKTADISEGIQKIAGQVKNWCDDGTSVEQIHKDIESILEFAWNSANGFEMAKAMEDKGYSADSELVAIMDGNHWAIKECVRKAVKEWVRDYDIQPKYEVGAKITLPASILREEKDLEGEITSIDTEEATYTICIPELGHIKEGIGTHGRVYKFEVIHELNQQPETTKQ